MLSHIVTAAKGLFSAQDPADSVPTSSAHDGQQSPGSILPERPKNMVSTRRTRYGTVEPDGSSSTKASPAGSAKRKTRSAVPSVAENRAKKRKTVPEGVPAIAVVVDNTPVKRRNGTIREEGDSSNQDDASVASAKANSKSPGGAAVKSTHMRFGSEEPIPAPEEDAEAISEAKAPEPVEAESSDDDEAPETFDNSAQLANMKAAIQNAEQAKLRQEQLKKEKRKERDQRLKSQAVSKKSKDLSTSGGARPRAPEQDDMMSESTATLQDSGFKDLRNLAGSLPALLPDEILNSEPAARLPTPVSDNDKSKPRISQKRKFLDEEQKPPKDVRRGGTTIRVLDGSSGKTNSLAPRVSKAGKHVRENWLSGNRSGANTGGLRRTSGAAKGFVRKG